VPLKGSEPSNDAFLRRPGDPKRSQRHADAD
jgi:hypothetical protein